MLLSGRHKLRVKKELGAPVARWHGVLGGTLLQPLAMVAALLGARELFDANFPMVLAVGVVLQVTVVIHDLTRSAVATRLKQDALK